MHKCSVQKRCKENKNNTKANIFRCTQSIDATAITGNHSAVLYAKKERKTEKNPDPELKAMAFDAVSIELKKWLNNQSNDHRGSSSSLLLYHLQQQQLTVKGRKHFR